MNTRAYFELMRNALVGAAALTAVLGASGCDSATSTGGGVGYVTSYDVLGDGAGVGDASGGDTAQGTDGTDAASADATVLDVQVKDTAVADVGTNDSGPVDTGPVDTGPADTGPGPNCSKTDYTKVQDIFVQNCNGCHGHQFGTSCAKATSDSSIKSKVSNGSMPPGGFSNPADKALVLKWYTDGKACTPAPGCP